jgi:hypothetical protein
VITLYITPVIYLYLDRFSGSGPLTTRIEGEKKEKERELQKLYGS